LPVRTAVRQESRKARKGRKGRRRAREGEEKGREVEREKVKGEGREGRSDGGRKQGRKEGRKIIFCCSSPLLNSLLQLVYFPKTIHYKYCFSIKQSLIYGLLMG